jgi:hypothetical protein
MLQLPALMWKWFFWCIPVLRALWFGRNAAVFGDAVYMHAACAGHYQQCKITASVNGSLVPFCYYNIILPLNSHHLISFRSPALTPTWHTCAIVVYMLLMSAVCLLLLGIHNSRLAF